LNVSPPLNFTTKTPFSIPPAGPQVHPWLPPPAALPLPPHPPSSTPPTSSASSFDSLLIAGEKGVALAVLDVDAAELKPLATYAEANVIAADVCAEFGVLAALTGDNLLLLKVSPHLFTSILIPC